MAEDSHFARRCAGEDNQSEIIMGDHAVLPLLERQPGLRPQRIAPAPNPARFIDQAQADWLFVRFALPLPVKFDDGGPV
jgi:hypothetical protein